MTNRDGSPSWFRRMLAGGVVTVLIAAGVWVVDVWNGR